jgi:MoxR-like ATPase
MHYPDPESEVDLLYDQAESSPLENLTPVLSGADLLRMQAEVNAVRVDRSLADYLVRIVGRTRAHPGIRLGCSPRGAQMLFRAAQAWAYFADRDFILPDDIQRAAPLVLEHRILCHAAQREAAHEAVRSILEEIEVPL